MALALVWEEESDDHQVHLGIDTGTSPFYRVLLGTSSNTADAKGAVLGDVYWTSEWQRNPAAGRHLRTTARYRLDAGAVSRPRTLLQLHSARDQTGRASAFSRPLRLSRLPRLSGPVPGTVGTVLPSAVPSGVPAMTSPLSQPAPPTAPALRPVRNVPVRSAQETYSRPVSLDDLLGTAIRAALPLLQQLLSDPAPSAGTGNGAGVTGADGEGGGAAVGAAGPESAVAEVLASLLRHALGAGGGGGGSDVVGSLVGVLAGGLSTGPRVHALSSARVAAARPMVIGVDDALIGMLAGAALDKLPELVNAIGQARENQLQRNRQLMRDAMGATERLRLLEALEGAVPSVAPAEAPASTHSELLALLRALLTDGATVPAPAGRPVSAPSTAPAPAPAPSGAPLGATAAPASLQVAALPATPSRAALLPVLTPVPGTAASTPAEFSAVHAMTLRFRLDTGPGGPVVPLPRSILRLTVHEPGSHAELTVVDQRLEHLAPGAEIRVPLPAAEVRSLPQDVPLEVRSALRWPGTERTFRAGASTLVVLRGPRAVQADGPVVGEPVELTDMARFRPFWNRVWSFDPSGRWGLDAAVRYSVVLTSADRGNALMATRSALGDPQPGARADHVGRLKSGLEVSVHELNRLLPLWPGHPTLSPEELAPFAAPSWLAARGGDAIVPVRFDGSQGTRGLLWAVPVLTLRQFEVAAPAEIDPFGQILSWNTGTSALPTIESVRLLGLESTDGGAGPERTDSGFAFEGFRVRFETVAGLEPANAPEHETQAVGHG